MKRAFTIVELLIVIVVIAILTGITIVVFNGISKNAIQSSLSSDLRNTASKIASYKIEQGSYPPSLTTEMRIESNGTELEYSTSDDTFCLSAVNSRLPELIFSINQTGELRQVGCVAPKIAGVDWQITATPGAAYSTTLAYGDGVFVMVSSSASAPTAVYSSTDGRNWTPRTAPRKAWRDIEYAAGRFVVIGADSVMSSTDGIAWTEHTIAGRVWNAITYGAGKFVAVPRNSGSTVAISEDGINWAEQSAFDGTWSDITYSGSQFVAVASSGTNRKMTSPDGLSWTVSTGGNWYSGITYIDGMYIGFSGTLSSTIPISTDTVTWSTRAVPSGIWSSFAYGNGRIVGVSRASGSATHAISSIDGGVTWLSHPLPEMRVLTTLVYGNGCFVGAVTMAAGAVSCDEP